MQGKRLRVLLAGLERQGCTIVETKKGYRILCPDGVSTLGFHKTASDHRAEANIRGDVKRAGLQWPLNN